MTIPRFEKGTTIRFTIVTKNFEGNPITPTSTPTCKVFDLDDPGNPIATLNVSGTASSYETYWNIPTNLPASGNPVTCPKCGYVINVNKIYYAEWAWIWDGKDFIERVPFDVVIVEE